MSSPRAEYEDDRLGLRVWRLVEYLLWLPVGTAPDALVQLEDIRVRRIEFLASAHDELGRRHSSWELLRLAMRDLPQTALEAFEHISDSGADQRWVYGVSDPLMVFGVLPFLVVATGSGLGGFVGGVVAAAFYLVMVGVLVDRLRSGMIGPVVANEDAYLTLPNVLTALRLATLWLLPLLLSQGHHVMAAVYLAAAVSTDWADGFIARHYALTSRIGEMMDPTADRLLMVIAVGSMARYGFLPFLLASLLLTRETVTMLFGVFSFMPHHKHERPKVQVHWAGKVGFSLSSLGMVVILAAPPLPVDLVNDASLWVIFLGLLLNIWALMRYVAESQGWVSRFAPSE